MSTDQGLHLIYIDFILLLKQRFYCSKVHGLFTLISMTDYLEYRLHDDSEGLRARVGLLVDASVEVLVRHLVKLILHHDPDKVAHHRVQGQRSLPQAQRRLNKLHRLILLPSHVGRQ